MALLLRSARPEEAPAIRDLVRLAYALYVERMDREPAPMLADYEALVGRGEVTVAEDGGRLAGILVCYPRGGALHVENVAIDPSFQGRGIGQALMDHAEAEARSLALPAVELYTNEVMTENIGFYAARGYIVRERGEQDGYARIFFEKRLAPE